MQDDVEYAGIIVPQRLWTGTRGAPDAWNIHTPPSINFKVGGRLGVSIKAIYESIRVGKALKIEPLSDTCAAQWASYGDNARHYLRIEVSTRAKYLVFVYV